jgi:hypothetical protein
VQHKRLSARSQGHALEARVELSIGSIELSDNLNALTEAACALEKANAEIVVATLL